MSWVVDVGNSSINWSETQGKQLVQPESFIWHKLGMAESLDQAWGESGAPERITCACVAGKDIEAEMTQWCRDVWQMEPEFIQAQQHGYGVSNAYLDAERLGADRWAALVAVRSLSDSPACIVDCGTAITIDVMESGGKHLGGLILPGIGTMRSALLDRIRITLEESEGGNSTLFARNTTDGVNGGVLYAIIATLDRVYNDVDAEMGTNIDRIITGGDAATLLPLLKGECKYMPDLVLQGLTIMSESRQGENE